MLVPGQQLWDQILVTQAGIWATRLDDGEHVFVVKLTRALAKHIMLGRPADLVVATVSSRLGNVRVLGFRVHDDPEHPAIIIRPVVTPEDLEALERLLSAESVSFELFDDTCLQTLTVRASISPRCVTLPPAVAWPGVVPNVNEHILDDVGSFLSGTPTPTVVDSHTISLSFTSIAPHRVSVAGVGEFLAGNRNEGDELEQSAEALLRAVLGRRVVRGPRLLTSETKPELCDVLAFGPGDAYSLIVQAKVDGVLAASPTRTPDRRKKAIAKHFAAAVSQGRGAARALRRGARIEVEGQPFDIPLSATERIHVLVILSEMYAWLDSEAVVRTLLDASDANTLFHVIDLSELQRLVTHIAGAKPAVLVEPNLVARWYAMKTHRTPFIVGRRHS